MNIVFKLIIAILVSALFTGRLIPILKKKKIGQPIREEGNKEHYAKEGTPTMGGLAFTLAALLLIALFEGFSFNSLVVMGATLGFGLIGFTDDYEKISAGHNLGLTPKQKLLLQFVLSLVIILIVGKFGEFDLKYQAFPFIEKPLYFGFLAIPILMFIMVGTVNAVNLTDGLDGLLTSVSIPVFFGLYIINKTDLTSLGNISVIFAGVLLGYLIYNSNPASIFMGDTGSMAIGGAVSSILLLMNKSIFLIIIGGIYFVEALSVIIQVISFQKTGKRVFLMSPIHHHYELKGYKESKIVASFMVVSIILTALTVYLLA